MRFPLFALALLLVSGCTGDDAPPAEDDGVARLASERGLVLFDRETGLAQRLTQTPGLAWVSPSGRYVLFDEASYAVLMDVTTAQREVVPRGVYVRVYDDTTGLRLDEGRAEVARLATGEVVGRRGLPAGGWDQAADDFAVLAAEEVAAGDCRNRVRILRDGNESEATGCHVRVSADGRVGWTEGGRVKLAARDGAVRELAPEREGVAHENPVFTADGELYLRVVGARPASTELVAGNATVLRMGGPARLAIHDASADGRLVLLRVFDR